ncbi:GntR family transcriptional regulator [Luteolibacter marinus]|uniref:GntR family transcriptional regulator n=1 Tax=Luteolibacter marinus TaxID=2776705 RepID=UPI001866D19F|nr:LacI family DNA-binding transcriptional regulator [Luteolibacter marinus]
MKHKRVYDHLHDLITRGELAAGDRLPTEVELAERFKTSRPTAARALNLLEAQGMIFRRAGSGSFVSRSAKTRAPGNQGTFGLLVHGIGHTEIFEPTCAAIAAEAERDGCILRLSSGASDSPDLLTTCRRLIRDGVDGVFFAPVELDENTGEANRAIISELAAAGIPVVLLDRDYLPYPGRSELDLVGLQNYRSGHALGSHLIARGARRIEFLARPGSAATVRQRHNGIIGAMFDHDLIGGASPTRFVEPGDLKELRKLTAKWRKEPTAVACANDITAGELLQSLRELGFQVPGDLIVGSFDDVRYAKLLRPALTSVRQPVEEIGRLAYHAMSTRLARPDLPAREIRAEGTLVVRDSTAGFGKEFR